MAARAWDLLVHGGPWLLGLATGALIGWRLAVVCHAALRRRRARRDQCGG
jgi:hypothetical protein